MKCMSRQPRQPAFWLLGSQLHAIDWLQEPHARQGSCSSSAALHHGALTCPAPSRRLAGRPPWAPRAAAGVEWGSGGKRRMRMHAAPAAKAKCRCHTILQSMPTMRSMAAMAPPAVPRQPRRTWNQAECCLWKRHACRFSSRAAWRGRGLMTAAR